MDVFTKSKSWKSMQAVDEKQETKLLWPKLIYSGHAESDPVVYKLS
jgi:hypothetical protein